jgi:hypothetical protein
MYSNQVMEVTEIIAKESAAKIARSFFLGYVHVHLAHTFFKIFLTSFYTSELKFFGNVSFNDGDKNDKVFCFFFLF